MSSAASDVYKRQAEDRISELEDKVEKNTQKEQEKEKRLRKNETGFLFQRHFCYTDNETSEAEIRKKIPFDIATRKIKYLGIHLTKEVKDLYSENYTTLKK